MFNTNNYNNNTMLWGYLSEFKPLTVFHRARIAALLFIVFGFSYLVVYRTFDSCQIRLPEYLISTSDVFSSALSFNSLQVSYVFFFFALCFVKFRRFCMS